jgi:hypothetical protein
VTARWAAALLFAVVPSTALASPAIELQPALETSFDQRYDQTYTRNGVALMFGIGGIVAQDVAVLARARLSFPSGMYTASVGAGLSAVTFDKLWLSAGVSLVWLSDFGQHCFGHSEGWGPQFSVGFFYDLSSRVGLGIDSAVSRTADYFDSSAPGPHADVEIMFATRLHWYGR